MKHRVCTSCHFVGEPVNQCLASFIVDAFIWGTVGSFAFVTGLLPALLIPIAWTLYHLAKFGNTKCPECGDLEMVALTSRKGHEALNPSSSVTTVWTSSEEATA